MLEDLWYKMLNKRDLLTWEYFVGLVIVLLSIITFLWASESVTNGEMFVRLGLTAFLCTLGYFWFSIYWKRSISDIEKAEKETWERAKKKIKKADKDKAEKILNHSLRYRLVGDTLDGGIDLERPLSIIDDQIMTYEELCAVDVEDPEREVQVSEARASASDYINNLLGAMVVNNEPVAVSTGKAERK